MKPDIDKLERLAKGATPGEWHVYVCTTLLGDLRGGQWVHGADPYTDLVAKEMKIGDAAFIAAANPAAILELVAEHREALERIAELERERRHEAECEACKGSGWGVGTFGEDMPCPVCNADAARDRPHVEFVLEETLLPSDYEEMREMVSWSTASGFEAIARAKMAEDRIAELEREREAFLVMRAEHIRMGMDVDALIAEKRQALSDAAWWQKKHKEDAGSLAEKWKRERARVEELEREREGMVKVSAEDAWKAARYIHDHRECDGEDPLGFGPRYRSDVYPYDRVMEALRAHGATWKEGKK